MNRLMERIANDRNEVDKWDVHSVRAVGEGLLMEGTPHKYGYITITNNEVPVGVIVLRSRHAPD